MTPKHAGGRPSKYTKENLLAVRIMAEHGYTNEDMARELGVHRDTFQFWMTKYKEFSDTIKTAKEKPDNLVEAALFKRAVGYEHEAVKILVADKEVQEVPYIERYPPDPTSMIFYLKNRRPDKWREKQEIEHSGALAITNLTPEERAAELAIYEAKLAERK